MPKPPVTLIVDALHELLEHHAIDASGPLDGETRLFGRDGLLDSLGLVTLVVAVEQAIADEYGVSVSLADDRALSQRHSPYRTVGSLAEYCAGVLDGAVARG
jgi:acyl carrier protein